MLAVPRNRALLSLSCRVYFFSERFLEQERTIILAVVPANQDVATVDILERAKMVRRDEVSRISFSWAPYTERSVPIFVGLIRLEIGTLHESLGVDARD